MTRPKKIGGYRRDTSRHERIEGQFSAAHLRLARTFVERLHWKTCIERYDRPHTFFYLDPPYRQTEGGYGVPCPFEDYEAIARPSAL